MKTSTAMIQQRRWIFVIAGILLTCSAYYLVTNIRLRAPAALIVSNCEEPKPEATRIGNQSGFQFDVPTKEFNIREGMQDMPPFAHGFGLKPKNSAVELQISWGRLTSMEGMGPDPNLVIVTHLEKRAILDDNKKVVGEDYWGSEDNRARWRQVRLFRGEIVAKYASAPEKEAELLDHVIDTACFVAAPDVSK